MPFYEYQCRHCGHQTEVLQKVSDPPLRKCPACGRNGLTKLISAPIFRLKGGGWYKDGYSSKKGQQ
jgi:putative FmdB family regulatory protein